MRTSAKFIRSNDGNWHNLDHIRTFYIGGDDDCGYRICLSYEIDISHSDKKFSFSTKAIGESHPTAEKAQESMDDFMKNKFYWLNK
jgi:hypothetical protein